MLVLWFVLSRFKRGSWIKIIQSMSVCKSAALLEDEKRSNSKQTEESTKQIQFLQS